MGVDQRVAEVSGREFGLIGLDGGVAPVGVVEGQGAEAAESFEFREGMEPGSHLLVVASFPLFQLEGLLEVPEEEGIERDEDDGVEPIVEPVEDLVQGFDGCRCAAGPLAEMGGEGLEQGVLESTAFHEGDAVRERLHFGSDGVQLRVERVHLPADIGGDDEKTDDAREELLEADDVEGIDQGKGDGQGRDDESDGLPGGGAEAIGFLQPGFDGFFGVDGQVRCHGFGLEVLPPGAEGGEFFHGVLPGVDLPGGGGVEEPVGQELVALFGAGAVDELEDGGAAEDIEVVRVGVVFVVEWAAIGLMGELVVEVEQFLFIDPDQTLVARDGLEVGLVFSHQDQEDGDEGDGRGTDRYPARAPDQPYGCRARQHREQACPAEDILCFTEGIQAGFEGIDALLIEYGRGLGGRHGVKLAKGG